MMKGIYLLLGSNLDSPHLNILNAIGLLKKHVTVRTLSRLYESEPWGNSAQPAFLNQVMEVETSLTAEQLLDVILTIEKSMGRVRKKKWGERLIDIDILYYTQQVIDELSLTIPHPEIQNRRFTLLPLNDIAAGFVHPVLSKTQEEMLEECKDRGWVRQLTSEFIIR